MELSEVESPRDLAPAQTKAAGASSASQSVRAKHVLPANPVVIVEPSSAWPTLGLRDIWAYRELLYFLTWRDVKVRYKQTALGIAWAVLQPLLTMVIFTLFFGRLAGIRTGDIPYPLFAFAGLVPWTFFANAITNSGNSLVGSANLITKVYFPRMIIPGGAVCAGLVDFALAFIILIGMMAYYGIAPSWHVVLLPVIVAMLALLALATGLWMSALNVKYRDIRYALPFLVQLWMFVSAVIYPSSMTSGYLRLALKLNPVAGFIENFRAVLFGSPIDWGSFLISSLLTIALLFYAAMYFRSTEKTFADVV
jgi:homopolymeric O-antigen transport system permease protein